MAEDIQYPAAPASPIAQEGTLSDIPPSQQIGADVNVMNPEGELVSIPQEHLQDALASGYSHAAPEAVAHHFKQEDYGSAGQIAATAAEGLAQGVAGPLATAAEIGLGISTPEAMRAREEVNPGTHLAGELTGFAGSAVLGTGEAALLGKAGEAVGAASGLGKAGSGFIEQVGLDAVKGAFETALYQGGDELSKAFKEDPEQTAGHAIADIGLAGVMGGVFGGAVGAGLRKLGLHPDVPTESEAFIPGASREAYEAGDLKTHVELDPNLKPDKKASILEAFNLKKQKPNAKAIEAARETLGAPETPGMLLESPLIQMQVDSLAHSPYTYSGNKIRTVLDNAYEHAESALQGATSSANNQTRDELGHAVQSSLTSDIREAYAPSKAAYAGIEELHPHVPVSAEDIGAFRASLKDIKEVALGPATDEGKLARQVVNAMQNAKSAEDLSTIRNMSALKKSGVGSDPLGRIKGILRDRIEAMQEEAIDKYAKSFPRNDEVGAMMQSLIEQNKAAKELYKPYIRQIGELSEWLGKGKIHGTEDALNFLNERLSASDVAKRLFSSSKDPAFLKFFSEKYPKQFALVRDYQRMALRDAATTGEEFSPKSFFNKFNELEPELQKALYTPEELKKIAASETYIRGAFPKDYNPSHTSHAKALKEAYSSPKGMVFANARDFAMEQVVKAASNSPRAAQAVALAKATVAGDKLASRGIKSIFGKVSELPAALTPLAAHREKLSKIVDTYQADPSKMFGQGDSNPVPEYAQAFSATSARAVQYLSTLKPDTTPKNPLDTKLPPSNFQKATYNRALDIAQQPLNVLARIKQGTLTPQDMTTLKTIYPSVYQNLSNKIMTHVVDTANKGETIPYATRLQLSMFLGQPLDSTMTQPAIATMQARAQAQQQQAATPQAPASGPKRSTAGLNKLSTQAQTPGQARLASKSDNKL